MLCSNKAVVMRRTLILGTALAILTTACGDTGPTRMVALRVDSAGTFTLDGKIVEYTELKRELQTLSNSTTMIQLNIYSVVDTKYEAVGKAVLAAQEARIARISLVTEPPK
jgi:biopolymer transport protein ExbD